MNSRLHSGGSSSIISAKSRKSLRIISINIQSIFSKTTEVEVFLNHFNPDIFCTSEHWMNENRLVSEINGNFSLVSSFCRQKFKNGGVGIYCKNSMLPEIKEINIKSQEKQFECSGIKITSLRSIIIVAYRSPDSNAKIFLNEMNDVLGTLSASYKKYNLIVYGDFNIDS